MAFFLEGVDCTPEYEPDCVLRPLNIAELNAVTEARGRFTANGCQMLNGWFGIGFNERLFMWDREIQRFGETLKGDYHGTNDNIHIYTDTDDFARTLAHELLHWYYGNDLSHDEIYRLAELCSGIQS